MGYKNNEFDSTIFRITTRLKLNEHDFFE